MQRDVGASPLNKCCIFRMSLPFNILITTPTFPPFNSGLGNAVQEQARILVSLGYAVTIATYGPQRQTEAGTEYCIERFKVTGADSRISPIKGEIESYRTFLCESHFDIVIANAWQTWSTDIVLQYMSQISGRVVLCSHCISTNIFFKQTPLRSLLRYLLWRPYHHRVRTYLKQLDGLVVLAASGCDSRFDDLTMARKAGTQIHVVPNALPDFSVDEVSASFVPICDRRHIISVGAYEWPKGHDFVLKAYARSQVKNVVPLKIFGQKFTPFTDELKALAKRLGIADNVLSFHEGIAGPSLISEYRQARVFLYGSHTECQPLVLLDAMLTGTPFVSRASGCIDTLQGGMAVQDINAAVTELNRLLSDDEYWSMQSQAGLAGVQAHSHDNVRRSWDIALKGILKKLHFDEIVPE